jgi:tetratricopeptide (TPR) repeat protein
MKRYALVIGINKYDGAGFNNLRHSVTDAESIALTLEKYGDFTKVERLPHIWNDYGDGTGKYAVADNSLNGTDLGSKIHSFLEGVGQNAALIYFSGHGLVVKDSLNNRNGYLIASDCTSQTVSKGISLESLNRLISKAECNNLTVLLDCCHSGSSLEESQLKSELNTILVLKDRHYFLATACRSNEKAYEGKEYSLFTAAVIKALESPGTIKTRDLERIVFKELTGSGQEPFFWGSRDITLTYPFPEKVEANEPDKLQAALEKLRSDYQILDEAFFKGVAVKVANKQARTQILSRRAANWSMLFQESYVERDQQGEALETALGLSQNNEISLMLICGEPGAGKTALLRWLARELFYQGKRVFHKEKQSQFGWLEQLRKFSEESGEEHFYVITDDLFRDEMILDQLEQNEFPFPLTLIGTTRQNENRYTELQGLDYEIICLNLEKTSEAEKRRILDLPEVQTHLAGKSEAEKKQLMDSPIMLVLMLQLSEGKTFEVLLWKIIRDLPNTDYNPLYQVFGVLCSFFQYGIAVPFEILQLCLPLSDLSEKSILSSLEGLVDVEMYGGYEGLTTIHELIAKTVMLLNYKPQGQQNKPYAWSDSSLLEKHLEMIVFKMDETLKIHYPWILHSFQSFIINGETDLICKILRKYSQQIENYQKYNTVFDWVNWAKIYSVIGWENKYEDCINLILNSEPNSSHEYVKWLSLVQKFGSSTQQKLATLQTQIWLENHPDNNHVRTKYLSLVERYGNREQKQSAISQTQIWLENHPDNNHVRIKYLSLVERYGNREQKQSAISQTQIWLENHPDNIDVYTKYLSLVERCGSPQQKQSAIFQAQIWLENHPDNEYARTHYLGLVERCGSSQQKQSAISQTQIWLENHQDDHHVRHHYLGLVERCGSPQQKQSAISQTQIWLENHQDDHHVRAQYLILIARISKDINIIKKEIHYHWKWVVQQYDLKQNFWIAILPVLYHHADSVMYRPAIELVLKQHPNDQYIICLVFGYFRDYLDINVCHNLANCIKDYKPLPDKWQNFIHAANFFRDYGEMEKAQKTYDNIIDYAKKRLKQYPDIQIQKTLDFANLSYAQFYLMTNPPQPDISLGKLDTILKKTPKHSYAHLLMAQLYQIKGNAFNTNAKKHFEKAIEFDEKKSGVHQYQFGCFYRYSVENNSNARMHFEISIAQNSNLPAYLELAELEAEDGNIDRAKTLLQNGLEIPIITRPQREEQEKFSDRITTLKLLLDIPAS